ncbi:MAG: sigma-54-dependent Fis family transcriptional regulator [Deltaproteobacteria bacterium]|nr:sigma-54-dependent Fis family transcriptional regulator [Deltaproteobacteria bacterium]
MNSILVIDDERSFLEMLKTLLKKEGYVVTVMSSAEDALDLLEKESFDACLCDIKMPKMDGLDFLRQMIERKIKLTVIMMSAYGTMETAIDAMKLGAYDYISKPFKRDEVILTLRKVEERERLRRENLALKNIVKKEFGFENIIARSAVMNRLFETIRKIADYKTTVLLIGESGTGKELIAKAIHYNSSRSDNPFVVVNCGAIPENLLESELFGYVKGAFTDAFTSKKGLFEAAHGGTIFLDEIGELPLALQVKLLRVLQEGEIRRIGDTKPLSVDVRVIAATARDISQMVNEGKFREDLFYRLNVIQINVPPLRDRLEDIPILVEHFLRKTNEKLGIDKIKTVSPEVMKIFYSYGWGGNVRELENVIERAIVLADGEVITPELISDRVTAGDSGKVVYVDEDEISLKKRHKKLEIEMIRKALERTRGNRSAAARLLEISHRKLLYKIKEYGIN